MRALSRVVTLTLLALSAPALAQDPPKPADPPKPEVKPAAVPAARKERKVDPKAQALLDAYTGKLITPRSAGIKSFTAKGSFRWRMMSEPAGLDPCWNAADGLSAELVLPASMVESVPAEQVEAIRRTLQFAFVEMALRPLVDSPVSEAAQYDVLWREDAAGPFVKLFPWAEKTHWDLVILRFGADGALASMTGTPHVDMDDAALAGYAGTEVELRFRHAKRGEKLLLEGADATLLGGDASVALRYYEVPGLPPLIAGIHVTGVSDAKFEVTDYIVDGKAVPETAAKKKEEAKPAEPKPAETAPPPEAPKEPAK